MMKSPVADAIDRMSQQGFKAKTVSVTHLPELQENIDRLIRQGLIDESLQKSFLTRFRYDPSEVLLGAKSVFMVSIPLPITRVTFIWQGRTYRGDLAPGYFSKTENIRAGDTLSSVLETAGYRSVNAELPLKTLAVRSGLAQYGRNNITYVPSFGSFQRLMAFYSDCPCDTDSWQELQSMKNCEKCNVCKEVCPTGSIRGDRFLIHAENCRTWSSVDEQVVQEWIRNHWHNMLVGCILCQSACPVNKDQSGNIVMGPELTEEEATLIIQKTPQEKLPGNTRQKLAEIPNEVVYNMLARNIKALITVRGAGS
jgi:epoxyqueuosine reductase